MRRFSTGFLILALAAIGVALGRLPLADISAGQKVYESGIVFEAPRFKDGELARPAFVTVLHNGVLVQNHVEILGNTAYNTAPKYTPHAEKLPLVLMYHGDPVRFRNIWIREIRELEGKKP